MSTDNKINSNFYQVAVVDGNADVTGLTVADITATTSANLGTVTAVTITGGINGQVLSTDGSGNLSWATAGGTPGGTDTQVQFNSGGVFAGDPGFTYNTSTQTVTLGNTSTRATLEIYANSPPSTPNYGQGPLTIGPDFSIGADSTSMIKAGSTDYQGLNLALYGGDSSVDEGGAVFVKGGTSQPGSFFNGGHVNILGGNGDVGGNVNITRGTGPYGNGIVAISGRTINLIAPEGLLLSYDSGTAGQVLTSQGSVAAPVWSTVTAVTTFNTSLSGLTPTVATSGAVTLAGTLGAISGGTSQSTYATGDILYASNTNTLSKLGIGATGTVLTVSGGVPSWAAATGGGGGQDLISYSTCGGA